MSSILLDRSALSEVTTERAIKVFKAEQDSNYTNISVIGGLDAFIHKVAESHPKLKPPKGWHYKTLSLPKRKEWLLAAIKMLQFMHHTHRRGHSHKKDVKNIIHPSEPINKIRYFPNRFKNQLDKVGIKVIKDALLYMPNRYENYTTVSPIRKLYSSSESLVTVVGYITSVSVSQIRSSAAQTRVTVSDDTSALEIVWFNQHYLAKRLQSNIGRFITVSGSCIKFRGYLRMINPEYQLYSFLKAPQERTNAGGIIPTYPSTEGLPQRTLRNIVRQTVNSSAGLVEDILPKDIQKTNNLLPVAEAIKQVHFPDTLQKADKARERLAFDELIIMQLAVQKRRMNWKNLKGISLKRGCSTAQQYVRSLDFALTTDQQEALSAIIHDISTDEPMIRLLQGEVGSGKTVIAISAIVAAAASGCVGALLVPTEVLAEQHFISATSQLKAESIGITDVLMNAVLPESETQIGIGLLTGSLSSQKKRWMHNAISQGKVQMLIGTHALFQESVDIPNLALVVVDEQHRFGVEQRNALTKRQPCPHMLTMSATPIPQTLEMSVFGYLDVSVLKQMPHSRKNVITRWVNSQQGREEAYALIRKQVSIGKQSFVVCPFIEESENVSEVRSALAEYNRLKVDVFPNMQVALLHSKMSIQEKQSVMSNFRKGKISVLVSTSVVEVGVDVHNASVIIIESADRFGLAQLHQLRGRVGRDGQQSWCMLITENEHPNPRISALVENNSGFDLSEVDLKIRGPGDYLGTRQSGWPDMKIAKATDIKIIRRASETAKQLIKQDPQLKLAEHKLIEINLKDFENTFK